MLEESILAAIGEMTIVFNMLEDEITYIAEVLFGCRDRRIAEMQLSNKTIGGKQDTLKKLLEYHANKHTLKNTDIYREFTELMKDMRTIIEDRNLIIHGTFEPHSMSLSEGSRSVELTEEHMQSVNERLRKAVGRC